MSEKESFQNDSDAPAHPSGFSLSGNPLSRRSFMKRTRAASVAMLAGARAQYTPFPPDVPPPTPASGSKPYVQILVSYTKTLPESNTIYYSAADWENDQSGTQQWIWLQIWASGSSQTNNYEWGDPADYESVSTSWLLDAASMSANHTGTPYSFTYTGGTTITRIIKRKKPSA